MKRSTYVLLGIVSAWTGYGIYFYLRQRVESINLRFLFLERQITLLQEKQESMLEYYTMQSKQYSDDLSRLRTRAAQAENRTRLETQEENRTNELAAQVERLGNRIEEVGRIKMTSPKRGSVKSVVPPKFIP